MGFLEDHMMIVKHSVRKFGDRIFQLTDISDDKYVYNVNINMKILVNKDRYTKKWITYFQRRRLQSAGDTKDNVYCLYTMREIENDICLELYMGDLVDFDENEKEEYQCGKLRVERCNPYLSMHYKYERDFHE